MYEVTDGCWNANYYANDCTFFAKSVVIAYPWSDVKVEDGAVGVGTVRAEELQDCIW